MRFINNRIYIIEYNARFRYFLGPYLVFLCFMDIYIYICATMRYGRPMDIRNHDIRTSYVYLSNFARMCLIDLSMPEFERSCAILECS